MEREGVGERNVALDPNLFGPRDAGPTSDATAGGRLRRPTVGFSERAGQETLWRAVAAVRAASAASSLAAVSSYRIAGAAPALLARVGHGRTPDRMESTPRRCRHPRRAPKATLPMGWTSPSGHHPVGKGP